MKKFYFIIIFLIISKALFSQAIPTSGCEIVYFYDNAGNRTQRVYYCNGNPTGKMANKLSIGIDSLKNADEKGIKVEALYPNPNDGKFTIQLNYELTNADVILRDLSGKPAQRFTVSGSKILFDISKEASGTYFLSIMAGKATVLTEKVIKAQ